MYTGLPIVITGFMCSGKSSVAATVAAGLSAPLIDLDQVVFELTGRSPGQIIADSGEATFRLAETEALASVLARDSHVVIALGGGTWISQSNRDFIEGTRAVTFWLDAPFEICWKRIQGSVEDRPLARSEDETRELFKSRRRHYALAQHRIEVGDKTVEDIAARIIRSLTQ